jgi:hypothetical protein
MPLPQGFQLESGSNLPAGFQIEKPAPEKGNMYTQSAEDIQYSPEGIPLNTSSYGAGPTGATKSAQQALTSTVSLPINIATGIAKSPAALVQAYDKYIGGGNTGDKMINAINQIEGGTQAQMGDVGSAVNQVGSMVGQAAPYMGIGNAGMIPSFAQKVAHGFGTGVLSGFLTPEKTGLTPEQYKDAKAETVALQGSLGAAFPVLGGLIKGGYKTAKAAIEPLYEEGRNRILGRALREFAGGEEEKAIANLRNPHEIVKGSQPTFAEVAGVPSLNTLERSVMASNPNAANQLVARRTAQNQARGELLNELGGKASNERDILAMGRENVANQEYQKAFANQMDFANLTPELKKEVSSLVQAPAIKEAISNVRKNALNKGVDIGDPKGSIMGLHEVKLALDSQINSLEGKIAKTPNPKLDKDLEGLRAAKGRLLNFLENDQVSPEYKAARTLYANMSKPINEMDIVQDVVKGSTNPLTKELYPTAFARKVQNIPQNALPVDKQQALNSIVEDIARTKGVETVGKGVGSDTLQKLAYNNMLNEVGIPNVMRTFAPFGVAGNIMRRGANVLYGDANRQLEQKLAEALMSPAEGLRLMESVGPRVASQEGRMMTEKMINAEKAKQLAKMLTMQRL